MPCEHYGGNNLKPLYRFVGIVCAQLSMSKSSPASLSMSPDTAARSPLEKCQQFRGMGWRWTNDGKNTLRTLEEIDMELESVDSVNTSRVTPSNLRILYRYVRLDRLAAGIHRSQTKTHRELCKLYRFLVCVCECVY